LRLAYVGAAYHGFAIQVRSASLSFLKEFLCTFESSDPYLHMKEGDTRTVESELFAALVFPSFSLQKYLHNPIPTIYLFVRCPHVANIHIPHKPNGHMQEKTKLISSRDCCEYQRSGRTDRGVSALGQVRLFWIISLITFAQWPNTSVYLF
jgi:tRNA U38,U39,U40 pseudouridine synthase TruA